METQTPSSSANASPGGALVRRNATFRAVWLGQVLAQGGARMYQIALIWWLIQRVGNGSGEAAGGGDGLAVGAFLLLVGLPQVLLFKPIGALIERHSAKTILVVAELTAAAVVATVGVLLWLDSLTPALAYAAGLLTAVCQAFVDPTLPKAVPELVDAEDVERAVAYETSTQSLANATGAIFGAIFVAAVGFSGAAWINVAAYAVAALLTSTAKFRPLTSAPPPAADAAPAPVAAAGLFDGIGVVRHMLIASSLLNFFVTPTFVILPLYVKHLLHGDAATLGALEASLWIGLLCGAFGAAAVPRRYGALSVAVAAVGILGLAFLLPGLLADRIAYAAALALSGVAIGVNNVKFVALFQKLVPDERKGRFFAAMQAILSAIFPIAMLLAGAAADHASPQVLCLIQAVGVFVTLPYLVWLQRSERTA